MTHQTLGLGKYWKLLPATLNLMLSAAKYANCIRVKFIELYLVWNMI